MLTLPVEKRLPAGKAGTKNSVKAPALRGGGKLPGVVYGAHYTAMPIAFSMQTFAKVLDKAGEATIVSLTGLGEPLPTLIHDVDLDPLTNQPRHVDFYAVTKGEKVRVPIPLVFVGESPAVEAGANLVKVLHEIEVEADPMDLPHDFTVDLSALVAINDQIHVRNLKLPAGVAFITDPSEVVVLTQEVALEKEEESAPADITSVEVEEKGKEEKESEDTITPEEKSAKG